MLHRMRPWFAILVLIVGAVLALSARDAHADGAVPPSLEPIDLALMLLPPEELPAEFSGFVHDPYSGYLDPPPDIGALFGYYIQYYDESSTGSDFADVFLEVELYTDAAAASAFINGLIADLVSQEGQDIGDGVILTSIDTYPIAGLGDKATRVVMQLSIDTFSVYVTIATFTHDRVVGVAEVNRDDPTDMQTQVETMATDLFARMKGVFSGAITSTTAPLPPDANCDGLVNSIDAVLVLQLDAGLVASLTCGLLADANGDGVRNALDALLMLQFDAGLVFRLPL